MTLVTKSVEVKVPVDSVFTYFARPEHVSDQMKSETVGMTVIPDGYQRGNGRGNHVSCYRRLWRQTA